MSRLVTLHPTMRGGDQYRLQSVHPHVPLYASRLHASAASESSMQV